MVTSDLQTVCVCQQLTNQLTVLGWGVGGCRMKEKKHGGTKSTGGGGEAEG